MRIEAPMYWTEIQFVLLVALDSKIRTEEVWRSSSRVWKNPICPRCRISSVSHAAWASSSQPLETVFTADLLIAVPGQARSTASLSECLRQRLAHCFWMEWESQSHWVHWFLSLSFFESSGRSAQSFGVYLVLPRFAEVFLLTLLDPEFCKVLVLGVLLYSAWKGCEWACTMASCSHPISGISRKAFFPALNELSKPIII